MGQRDEKEKKAGSIKSVRGLNLPWLALKMEERGHELTNIHGL